jgi:uncharacterized damage-inducible protein DinB
MRIVEAFLQELEQEAATTRRVLARVPSDKLDWRPHAKSMSLGQLAQHIATTTGVIAQFVAASTMEIPQFGAQPAAQSAAELLPTLEASLAQTREIIGQWDDATALSHWTLTKGDQVLMTAPRIGVLKSIGLNHWIHHRGQLSVYLRLLDVPLPSIYGPSADENPFA